MVMVLIIGLLALIVLNLYASIQCFRDSFPSTSQRLAQIVFIWVLPVLGAILVIRLLRIEPEQSQGKYPAEPYISVMNMSQVWGESTLMDISAPQKIIFPHLEEMFHQTRDL